MTGRTSAGDFREHVRRFLDRELPADWPGAGALDEPSRRAFAASWRRRLVEARLLGVDWPTEHGGGGKGTEELAVLLEEFTRRGVPAYPHPNDVFGVNLLGPTLLRWGTEAQRARFLQGTLSGEYRWAQGFSEPEAGSDLFSLRTTAVLDGQDLVLNGQKCWQSAGLSATWLFALVRTGAPTDNRHGLSFVLLPLNSPGVEVRGIRDMTGAVELSEVFFTDVRVPHEHVVGGVGNGLDVALTLLAFERGAGGVASALALEIELLRLTEMLDGQGHLRSDAVRQRLGRYCSRTSVLRSLAEGMLEELKRGSAPSDTSSVIKFMTSTHHRDVTEFAVETLGLLVLAPSGPAGSEWLRPQPLGADPCSTTMWVQDYLNARAGTIYGGSSEIQKNIIAERILGMPREVRPGSERLSRGRGAPGLAETARRALPEEQRALQRALGSFAEGRQLGRCSSGQRREDWRALSEQVGLCGVGVPERFGGGGGDLSDVVTAAEELGRTLLPVPFLASTVLFTQLLLAAGTEAVCATYLPDLAAGRRIGTVALHDPSGRSALDGSACRVTAAAGAHLLTGTVGFVVDGDIADLVLVPALQDGELALFVVDLTAADGHATVTTTTALDPSRPVSDLVLRGMPAARVSGPDPRGALDTALAAAGVALAGESVGAAEACLERCRDHALTRTAFGRTIGSFQAVKHKCASMYIGLAGARAAVRRATAALAAEGGAPPAHETRLLAATAQTVAAEAFVECASESLQIHGAVGFTWEHPTHWYLKRARSSFALLGTPERHYRLLADYLHARARLLGATQLGDAAATAPAVRAGAARAGGASCPR